MTTVNCSSNCKHQHDGKCTLEDAIPGILSPEAGCVYFEEKPDKNIGGFKCKPSNELL